LSAFARGLPVLCADLQGNVRIDAVHRLYEETLSATPVSTSTKHMMLCASSCFAMA
jgi:hypothetical protein